jgi:protein-S-isoprenylcysteine O-methyltransferase Ste14
MAQEGADWTKDLLDRLDHYIDVVRSNTTDRLVKVARLIVYGVIAAILGAMAAIVSLIAMIRVLDIVLPREVWLPYVVLGAIFLGAGLFLWSKKTAPRVKTGEV